MMNDEQISLANAYLDGELTDEERRVAEADPAVMAEVEDLRELRARLRDVEPPTDRARESAIASAMAAFGSAVPTPTPAPVITHRARPGYARYLAIAAAVVGVGLLGVVVANRPTSDDDAATQLDAGEAASTTEAAGADRAMTEAAGEPAADEPAEAAAEAAADEEVMVAEEAPAGGVAQEPAADVAADDDGAQPLTVLPPGAGETPDMPLTTPDEVGRYGDRLIEQRDEGRLPPTPNSDCPDPNVLARAYVSFGDDVDEVLVAVDESNRSVTAIDEDTCIVIVESFLRP